MAPAHSHREAEMESAMAQAIRVEVPPVGIRFSDRRPAKAMPYALYQRMERNVAGSFLGRSTWRQLIES